MKKDSSGRFLLLSAAAFTAFGGYLFDVNKTHLFNPKWTPHAKFHDAMTILLGSLLGGASLYLLRKNDKHSLRQLRWGAILPAFFWSAQAGAFAFPGAKGLEAEFPELVPQVGPIRLNEGAISITMLAVIGLGYALAKSPNQENKKA